MDSAALIAPFCGTSLIGTLWDEVITIYDQNHGQRMALSGGRAHRRNPRRHAFQPFPCQRGSATEAPTKRIAAQEIVLVDSAGGERAVLHLNDDAQPVFEMMDHAGKARIGIGFVDQDEVALRMANRSGALRVALNVSSEEVPALRLYDSQSRPRTLLGVDSDGDAALDFYESSGKLLRELP